MKDVIVTFRNLGRSTLSLGGVASVAVAVAVAAPQQPPVASGQIFRSTVDIVSFDVSVLDKDRRPVHGLTAGDFVVVEDDVPQRVLALTEVNVPTPDLSVASWVREAGVDVVSNDIESRRLIVLVLNDAYVSPAASQSTMKIANAVIDQLGPADLAAVVGTQMTRMENFTNDRAKLRAAVNKFLGQFFNLTATSVSLKCQPDPGALPSATRPNRIAFSGVDLDQCFMPAMLRVANVLATAPAGRKIVLLLGGALLGQPTRFGSPPVLDDVQRHTGLGRVRELVERLHGANTTVYVFDPNGVGAIASQSDELGLAEETGGRIAAGTNVPETLVGNVFAEISSYYLLAYQTTRTDTTGRFRRVRVSVNRPGVQVVARTGYFGPRGPSTTAAKAPAVAPEDLAITRSLPSGEQPVRVAAAAIRGPFDRNAGGRLAAASQVVATIAVREPTTIGAPPEPRPTSRRVNVVTTAFDATTYKSRGVRRDSVLIELAPAATRDSDYEITSSLPLGPGRYELRFAVERLGKAGSVFVTVEVPNFRDDRLSLSGVLLEKRPARKNAAGDDVRRLVPFLPTTARRFTGSETVRAFAVVYQGLERKVAPVSLTTEVKDTADRVVLTESSVLEPSRFENHAAPYWFDIAASRLPAGEYLLVMRATLDTRTVERTVRFSVE